MFSDAVREYVARHAPEEVTEAMDTLDALDKAAVTLIYVGRHLRTCLGCGCASVCFRDSRRTKRRVRKFAKLLDQHADLVFLIVLKIVMQAVDRALKIAFLADFPQQFRLDAVRLCSGEMEPLML